MSKPDEESPLRLEWETRSPDECPRIIQSYRIDSSFLTSTDAFTIDLYDEDPRRLRYLAAEPVKLYIYDTLQLIGRVDVVERGNRGRAVTIRGRDYIADLVENNVDPTLALKQDMTLAKGLGLAMSPNGIVTIIGNDSTMRANILTGVKIKPGKGKSKKNDFSSLSLRDLKPDSGEGVYEFTNKIVSRHGCTIQPSGSRDEVSLEEPVWDQKASYSLVRSLDESLAGQNSLVSATSVEDYSRFPTYTLFTGSQTQTGSAAKPLKVEFSVADFLAGMGDTTSQVTPKIVAERILPGKQGSGIGRLYRLLSLDDKKSLTLDQLSRAAARALGERLKDTLEYNFTVKGHRHWDTQAVWSTNTIVDVKDELCDLQENLWILKRSLYYQAGQGAYTDGTAIRIGSLQL